MDLSGASATGESTPMVTLLHALGLTSATPSIRVVHERKTALADAGRAGRLGRFIRMRAEVQCLFMSSMSAVCLSTR